ncbi:MAG: prepilin-type N-terminal cleavage/methylation domain-containing protein [Sedimentisphaerales bacterium]|nr:prepilin-type N-terminal cleavage/methylation domain-containing protein [Sedimentisphaerales bacterium]
MNEQGKHKKHNISAFTLVEILIVVVILGILAAVVIPFASGSVLSSQESSLGIDLQLLKRFALIYKIHHLDVTPGYTDGAGSAVDEQTFVNQATLASNDAGQTAAVGTAGYERGPYMQMIPVNPLNKLRTVQMIGDGESFPTDGDNSHGWVYKASTGEVRADSPGTDKNGTRYYDY